MTAHCVVAGEPDEVVLTIFVPERDDIGNLLPLEEVSEGRGKGMEFFSVEFNVAKHPVPLGLAFPIAFWVLCDANSIAVSHP